MGASFQPRSRSGLAARGPNSRVSFMGADLTKFERTGNRMRNTTRNLRNRRRKQKIKRRLATTAKQAKKAAATKKA